MPSWIAYILKLIIGQLIPVVKDWLYKIFEAYRIDKEVEAEFEEFESVKKQAQEWLLANPGKDLPKDIEDRLRELARKRTGGLR